MVERSAPHSDTSPRSFSPVDQRALGAIAVQFFVNGALFASFIPRLPEIRDRVGITVAGVGMLMSIAAVTGLIASATVGRAISRFGTRSVMLVAGTLVSLSLPIVGLATSPAVLLIGLAGMLSFDVFVDVSMNMQGSWLSARRHTPVMNRLHGLWSLGAVIGGISSARIAAAGVSLSIHLVFAGAILLAVLAYVGRGILRNDEHDQTSTANTQSDHRMRRLSPILALFLLAGFLAVAVESTSIEWATFRLTDDYAASAGLAVIAYVAVTAGMTIGRFAGDWATVQLGPHRLTQLSLALAGTGLAVASLVSDRYLNLAGYAIAGLGIATLLPMLYDTAAQHPGKAGAGLGALTAGLRTASLTIPLIVGTLAATSLSVGSAIAIVTLPSVIGFAIITIVLNQTPTPTKPA
jgi:MFS family permease